MFQDILKKQLQFPQQIKISPELKQLLSKTLTPGDLLCKDPNRRLGTMNGILDIVNHSWCKKLKLSDVMHRVVEPSLKPNPFVMHFEQFDANQTQIIKSAPFNIRSAVRNPVRKRQALQELLP